METRLNLLCEAGVIDKDICKGMMQVVNVLETECHLPVRSEQGTMAMTHMASALMRSRRGEEIEPLDNELLAELAHNQTGRPISTHTSFSTMGLEQLALLQAHGVDLSRVTVGHCDLKDNLDNILKMIDLGAYVQFDTIGKNSYYPDEKRIAMLHALRDRGLLNRVMLSMDITRRSHLKANGGYGYDYLLTTFIPQLRQSGFSQADVDVMLRENPSQFFQ
ncbi:phosphotriesterase-related protein [Escherichia coli]|nr:phosphotriesterase-related protein [Escherichia coli]EFF4798150.1 phosphotriesterase-related protein [Escherichia coli]